MSAAVLSSTMSAVKTKSAIMELMRKCSQDGDNENNFGVRDSEGLSEWDSGVVHIVKEGEIEGTWGVDQDEGEDEGDKVDEEGEEDEGNEGREEREGHEQNEEDEGDEKDEADGENEEDGADLPANYKDQHHYEGRGEDDGEDEEDSEDEGTVEADETCRAFVQDVLVRERTLDTSKNRSFVVEGLFGAVHEWDDADAAFIEVCYARVKTVCEVMAAALDDCGMQERGCHLMGAIAGRRPGLVRWMAEAGCAKVVLDAMARWGDVVKVQERALGALRAFTVGDEMRKAVMCAGGVQYALNAMRKHASSARVQDRGATVLANVSFGCPHRKRKIGQAGGLKQIVNAMSSHSNDKDIQLRGALALRNLAYHCQVNQYLAGREGAVEVVSTALLAFPDYCPLRYQAIVALTNLSVDDKVNRQRILDYGYNSDTRSPESKSALSAIIRTMREEEGNPYLLEHGLALLYHLSTKQPSAQERIGGLGGVDLALGVMEMHIDVASLVTKGCSLVRILCFTQQNRDRVSTNLVILINVVRKHMALTELAAGAIAALSTTMFNHEDNRVIVARKGGIEAVIRAMEKTPDNIPLQEQSCRALRNMIERNAENAKLVCELGGIEAIATALSMTSTCDSKEKRVVQKEAIHLLVELATLSPVVLKKMVEAAVADFIENALAKMDKESYGDLHVVGDDLQEKIQACEKGEESASTLLDPSLGGKRSAGISSGMFASLRGNGGKLRFKERLEQGFHFGSVSKVQHGKEEQSNDGKRRRPFGLHRIFGA